MKTRILLVTMVMCLGTMTARAQAPISPRAAMANCEMLPPFEYSTLVENPPRFIHTCGLPKEFVEHNRNLGKQVNKWLELRDAEINKITSAKQVRGSKSAKPQPVKIDPDEQMANIQRMMQDTKTHYRLTDKEFAALQDMSDKQGEAFIKKRCNELGIQPLDPSKYGMNYDPEEQARHQKSEAAMVKLPELEAHVEAYNHQFKVVEGKIKEWRKEAVHQCLVIEKQLEQEKEKILMEGDGGNELEYLTLRKTNRAKHQAVLEQYTLWQKQYLGVAREALQNLLSYAEAADQAKIEIYKIKLSTSNNTMEQMAYRQELGMVDGCASSVSSMFIMITEDDEFLKKF